MCSVRSNEAMLTSLAGGFSGTNYRVDFASGAVLPEVCHGYSRAFVEVRAAQAPALAWASLACFAIPLAGASECDEFQYASIDPDTGDPCIALTFVEGRAADAVIESGEVSERVILEQFGRALAEMHAVKIQGANLRHFSTGGACDVQKHIDGTLRAKMAASEHTRAHAFFTEFYPPRLDTLVKAMENNDLPTGILHGDPFLDNALVNPQTGRFSGFVDFEDATTGPLLFDVACAVIGTCFRDDHKFDIDRFKSFLRGYCQAALICHGMRAICAVLLSHPCATALYDSSTFKSITGRRPLSR